MSDDEPVPDSGPFCPHWRDSFGCLECVKEKQPDLVGRGEPKPPLQRFVADDCDAARAAAAKAIEAGEV